MNNNDWNNQNNFNNQYNGSNNQPVNNNMNNVNNQFNNTNGFQNNNVENTNYNNGFNNTNINNQSNLYNGNSMNQVETPKKKINTKLLAIIIGIIIIIVIVIVSKGFSNSSVLGSNENTTGSTEYKGSDVDYNCTYEYTNEDKKMKVYSDFIFNYKSTGDSGKQYNYQLKIYNKMIVEYGNGLTDSKYKDFVDSFESLECLGFGDEKKCTESHLELGITDSGWDTVVDRIGDKIEVTYYNIYGMGTTATKEDMKEIIEQYESNGYICK